MTRPTAMVLALTVLIATSTPVGAAPINGYGAMGDSLTDGNSFTGSWVPHLVDDRGWNFGGGGDPYNVAQSGATTSSLLSGGQQTTTAGLAASGDVDAAYLFIGGNDLLAVGFQIASGALSGAALTTFFDGMTANMATAADAVLAADPFGLPIVGPPDILLTPAGLAVFDTPIEIQRGIDAIDELNAAVLAMANARNLPFVDIAQAQRDLDALATLEVGGVTINRQTPSSDPHNFFQDLIHPGAVGNGLIANMMMAAVNVAHGAGFAPLSDLEVLTNAGLAAEYTGETLSPVINYEDFVTFVPVDGDVDGNRKVNFDDFLSLQIGFGITSGAKRYEGDLDGDGDVDFQDFLVLQIHFGSDSLAPLPGGSLNGASVPEPSTLALAALGLTFSLATRRLRTRRAVAVRSAA